jgi:hypothetical protein
MLGSMSKTEAGGDRVPATDDDAVTSLYDRVAWISYAVIFLGIPLVVLVFRLHMQAWHYYLAGALFVVGALLIDAMNMAEMAKRHQTDQTDHTAGR